jgi:hypothetical protein
LIEHCHDRLKRLTEDVVTVNDEKGFVHVGFRLKNRMSKAQTLALVHVRDWEIAERVPKVLDNLCAFVPDNNDEFVCTRLDCSVKHIREQRLTSNLDQPLRSIVSQFSKS